MTHCSSCNVELKKEAKFCTNCGAPIKEVKQPQKVNTGLSEITAESSKSTSKRAKLIVGLLAVIVLFFIVRSFVINIDITRNSMSISKALSKIEGQWHDTTGQLLGNKDAIINFRKRGDQIIGEDANNTLYIALLAYSANEYGGLVAINQDNENYTAYYDPDEDTLFFVGNLSKREWTIKKVNTKN